MAGLVFSLLLRLRRGHLRSARSRASLLQRPQAVSVRSDVIGSGQSCCCCLLLIAFGLGSVRSMSQLESESPPRHVLSLLGQGCDLCWDFAQPSQVVRDGAATPDATEGHSQRWPAKTARLAQPGGQNLPERVKFTSDGNQLQHQKGFSLILVLKAST